MELAGWQKQAGRATVQGALEAALALLAGRPVAVTGAGRTDAGVHAVAQVAHFDMMWNGSTAELAAALNARLPEAICVGPVVVAPPSFHARHSALAREYRYYLWPGGAVDPRLRRWCYGVRGPLAVPWMAEAAARFEGVHDFAGFGHPVLAGGTTVRRVDRCRVAYDGRWVVCEVAANAFLRHQVRRMVAALVDVGRGRLAPEAVTAALLGESGALAPGRVPAQGLTLTAVRYPPEMDRLWAAAADGRA
jgi:tRNA pseudouridine38-40 synthase